jgi:hypothetical protein
MAQIESQSDVESHQVRNFFKPSAAEFMLYILISIILLLALNFSNILNHLSDDYVGSPENLKANFSDLFERFSNLFSNALGGRLGQILLWSFIGALLYIGLWLMKNILNSFENDLIAGHYLHPSNFSRAGYWGSTFSIKIFLAAIVIITLAYVGVMVVALWPAMAALAGSAAYNFNSVTSPLYVCFAIIGLAISMYVAVVLFRLVSHLWKLL